MEYVELDQGELKELLDQYLKELYEYNEKLPENVRLKAFHYVKSKGRVYVYVGKYFYKYERDGTKLRWKYLGTQPPEGCPPPPPNPLDGLVFQIRRGKVYIRKDLYEKYFAKRRAKSVSSP
ncbi:hypothetical protein [Ignicoccus hospitalis]|uniref:Uncharacterized protein n=1 Tax=Ignicoccus hospitalis (strain KIN4/I / DSM 18386 / JCM 14125) TaxID=453591 RepID=A8AAQ7_IGNH4|nr:hypothetical protein [Ignicoccus hospitalis]ABU82009.1 hypothetical protein Igni_0827 [Ignicoccus hospitalis KIN4/I]HIH90966.1 hypothetical protein [Desulfurococcaceae archaeon]